MPAKKGCVPWNKGKTNCYSKETLHRIGKSVSNYYSSLSKEKSLVVQKKHQETALKYGFGYWMNGRKFNKVIREKMSKGLSGPNNPRWISDRNNIVGRHNRKAHDGEYKQWRKNVMARDKFKCRVNKGCNGRLEVHHIFPWKDYEDMRYSVNNGITLCHFHHPFTRESEKKLSSYFKKLVASTDQNRND